MVPSASGPLWSIHGEGRLRSVVTAEIRGMGSGDVELEVQKPGEALLFHRANDCQV